MSRSSLSKTYAEALLNSLSDKNNTEDILGELQVIDRSIQDKKKFYNFLDYPKISDKEKAKFLNEILQKCRVCDLTRNFCLLLLKNDRFVYFSDIVSDFEHFMLLRKGVVKADITYVHQISKSDEDNIRKFLEKETGKSISMSFNEDKNIIGGVIARVGDKVFDGSVRRQLEAIQLKMGETHFI